MPGRGQWLAEHEAELLPVGYFHVVYTVPRPIADIAYQNKRTIYDSLMKAAASTTLTIAADPKHLGAGIGITAVLHTWGSALTHHPHVHMIVPPLPSRMWGATEVECKNSCGFGRRRRTACPSARQKTEEIALTRLSWFRFNTLCRYQKGRR